MQNLLEQIDVLRNRANVTYAEAKAALEMCNYDVVEALMHLERENKIQAAVGGTTSKTFLTAVKDGIKSLIRTGNEYRFVIKKAENTALNIPVNILVLVTVLMPPVTITAALLALFTSHKIRFEKPDGGDVNINEELDKVSTMTGAVGDKVATALNKQ